MHDPATWTGARNGRQIKLNVVGGRPRSRRRQDSPTGTSGGNILQYRFFQASVFETRVFETSVFDGFRSQNEIRFGQCDHDVVRHDFSRNWLSLNRLRHDRLDQNRLSKGFVSERRDGEIMVQLGGNGLVAQVDVDRFVNHRGRRRHVESIGGSNGCVERAPWRFGFGTEQGRLIDIGDDHQSGCRCRGLLGHVRHVVGGGLVEHVANDGAAFIC